MAAGGKAGQQAEQLLASSVDKGRRMLGTIVKAAVARRLRHGRAALLVARDLFDRHERESLAKVLAAVNGTAELLGRARVRARLDGGKFAELDLFADLEPLPPERAVQAFRKRVPTLPTDPQAYAKAQQGKAFTLAVATEKTLLERVKAILQRGIEEGTDTRSLARQVEDVLDAAGVSSRNPGYAEMVVRTNVMQALNDGQVAEMQDPDVREFFPVWRYDGIEDGRERASHKIHFGRYYPNAVPFNAVRDSVRRAFDGFQCRCSPTAISADEWAELQDKGERIAPGYERFMKAPAPAKAKPKKPATPVVPEVKAPAVSAPSPVKAAPTEKPKAAPAEAPKPAPAVQAPTVPPLPAKDSLASSKDLASVPRETLDAWARQLGIDKPEKKSAAALRQQVYGQIKYATPKAPEGPRPRPQGKANPALPDASRPDLTDDESLAVNNYTNTGYLTLNRKLRSGQPLTPEEATLHAKLEAAMGKAEPFPKPVKVVSGRQVPKAELDGYMKKLEASADSGEPLESPGYLSTSTGGKIDDDFKDAPVVFRIEATHGLDAGPHTEFVGGQDERELILPHNARFKVKKVTRRPDGTAVVELTQIPPTPPDKPRPKPPKR